MERLTQENFRERVAVLQNEVRMSELTSGNEASAAHFCELIGNVCWHFAPPEAEAWFRRALMLRREAGWTPDDVSALLLWKLGDVEGFREENSKALEASQLALARAQAQPLSGDEFRDRDRERAILRAANGLAVAHFLAGDYRGALDVVKLGLAESARWAEWDPTWRGKAFGSAIFLEAMSGALLESNRERADQALTALREVLPIWPSDAGGQAEELYRYGLSLRDEHFAK